MKFNVKKWLKIAAVATLALGLTACGGGQEAANDKADSDAVEPIVLRFASTDSTAMWNDEEFDLMVAQKHFVEQLPIVTEGRYEVEIFLDGQLASSDTKELVQGLKSGAFDITEIGTGTMGEFTDAFSELLVPYMYKNQDVADAILFGEVGDDMMNRAAADIGGIVPLWCNDNGFRTLTHADKVIKTPADLNGVKIRVQADPVMIATFEALGCSVVSVPYSELFTALQQKLVEGQENPLTNIYNQKLFEVQSTCTETNHMFTAFAAFIRQEVWDGMSPEDQAAVEQLCKECEQLRADKMKEVTAKYRVLLEEEGLEFYTPTSEELTMFSDAMVSNVWPMCEENMGTERWEKLQNAVAAAEAELGL